MKKEGIINELRELLTTDVESNHKAWKKMTSSVIDMQKRWKEIGFAGKEHNENLWKQFRELADVFFEKKQVFYDKMKEEGKVAKKAKTALIEKAEALKDSTDWRETTQTMLQLQTAWKKLLGHVLRVMNRGFGVSFIKLKTSSLTLRNRSLQIEIKKRKQILS